MNPERRESIERGQPAMEVTTLTPEEEQLFAEVTERLAPSTPEQTEEFLRGHRAEAQGE